MSKRKQRFFVETFGCQMNVNDSEKVSGLMQAAGYERSASVEEADAVFINTCAVREKASDKLYHALGRLRRLKKQRPELRVGVGGCVAQLEGQRILERAPHVDVLVGTHNVARVPELFGQVAPGTLAQVDLDRGADSFAVAPEHVAHGNPVRAYVTVMEGCNHVCSFCVVPRTRGPEVCRDPEDILAEVRSLVARGVPEVMLLGQTVNAYRHGSVDFAELLQRVHDVPGLLRLRFTTSHPEHMSPRVARALGSLERLCPYVHLPVQSASERVLSSMRRGYSVAQYRDIVDLLRAEVPGLALSSDVIAGYPGETEDEFAATVALVDELAFDGLFVFAYSTRPGTTAARLPDDVPAAEKRRRVAVLNRLQQRAQATRNAARVGSIQEVLVERIGPDGEATGRSPQFKLVHFEAPGDLLGRLVAVKIGRSGPNSLVGSLISSQVSLTGDCAAPIL